MPSMGVAGRLSESFWMSPSLRGLDYYTGTIYETLLDDLPDIGSVCSGGRYDNLADLFTAQQLPGVGASLGLDRMLAALEELGQTQSTTTPAPLLVTMLDGGHVSDYLQLGRSLRKAGIATEVYPEAKNIGKQMKYADKKGFKLAVIAGGDRFSCPVSGKLKTSGLVLRLRLNLQIWCLICWVNWMYPGLDFEFSISNTPVNAGHLGQSQHERPCVPFRPNPCAFTAR